jgi:hypothetical protein
MRHTVISKLEDAAVRKEIRMVVGHAAEYAHDGYVQREALEEMALAGAGCVGAVNNTDGTSQYLERNPHRRVGVFRCHESTPR